MIYANCPECKEMVPLTKGGGFMTHGPAGKANECFGSTHYPKGIFELAIRLVSKIEKEANAKKNSTTT